MFGPVKGDLKDWNLHERAAVVTICSEDVYILKGQGPVGYLEKVEIDTKSKSLVSTQPLLGHTMIKTEDFSWLFLFDNGAIYKMKFSENSDIIPKAKLVCYICRHCNTLFRGVNKLSLHIRALHRGPVKCSRCLAIQDDIQTLKLHQTSCSYQCGVLGCNTIHKRLRDALRHNKKYLKSLE